MTKSPLSRQSHGRPPSLRQSAPIAIPESHKQMRLVTRETTSSRASGAIRMPIDIRSGQTGTRSVAGCVGKSPTGSRYPPPCATLAAMDAYCELSLPEMKRRAMPLSTPTHSNTSNPAKPIIP